MLINKNIFERQQYTLPFAKDFKYRLDLNQHQHDHHTDVLNIVASLSEYPQHDDHYDRLLKAIALYNNIPPESIILTNGSDNALKTLIEAFVTPSSKVIVPVPTYPHFISFLNNMYKGGVEYPRVDILSDIAGIDLKGANVCYLATPNLPLGYILSPELVNGLAVANPGTLFIIDEAYQEYGGGESKAALAITHNNVIVTRTFSKAFGLAGLRIGYIIARPDNVKLLMPLINEKNVTAIAVRAALAVMDNLGYYKGQIQEIENLKVVLSWQLNIIVKAHLPIYDYSINGGNFFLLFAKDPQYVCDIFTQHGIIVRNKHEDVANSVRISMGPQYMMDDVIKVCQFINLRGLLESDKILFDLDMTLRNGSKAVSKPFDGADVITLVDSIIVTNNNATPAEIHTYLVNNNLEIPVERIITSLYVARTFILNGGFRVFVYGNREYFADLHAPLDECDYILLATMNISMLEVVDICQALSDGKKLIYTDASEVCTANNSSEFYDESDYMIPDMESVVNMIRRAGYVAELIGKPAFDIDACVMIGDSDTDMQFGQQNNCVNILVGKDANIYNFDTKCIEITSVNYLRLLFDS